MDKRLVLRVDFFVQAALISMTIGASAWSWFYGQGSSWALLLVLTFVIWQFFSGIYIAAEFQIWYRAVPPGTLLVLVTMAILLAASGVDAAFGFILLLLVPLLLLSSLVLAAADWYNLDHGHKTGRWRNYKGKESILDTEDVFN